MTRLEEKMATNNKAKRQARRSIRRELVTRTESCIINLPLPTPSWGLDEAISRYMNHKVDGAPGNGIGLLIFFMQDVAMRQEEDEDRPEFQTEDREVVERTSQVTHLGDGTLLIVVSVTVSYPCEEKAC